jgi:hypothetical protein
LRKRVLCADATRRPAQLRRRGRVSYILEPARAGARLRLCAGQWHPRILQGQQQQQDRHRSRLSIPRRDRMGSDLAWSHSRSWRAHRQLCGACGGRGGGARCRRQCADRRQQGRAATAWRRGDIGIKLAAGIGDITLSYVGGPAPILRGSAAARPVRISPPKASARSRSSAKASR